MNSNGTQNRKLNKILITNQNKNYELSHNQKCLIINRPPHPRNTCRTSIRNNIYIKTQKNN